MYVCMYVCMHVWVYVCMYTYTYIYIYIYIHIHIYTYTYIYIYMAFGKHSKNIFCVCEIANLFHVKHEIFSLIFLLQVIFTSLLPSQ